MSTTRKFTQFLELQEKRLKRFTLSGLSFVFAVAAHTGHAQESLEYVGEWNSRWSSPYSRALGGSQTAHADNEDALFSNPAMLQRTRNPRSKKGIDVIDAPRISLGGNAQLLSNLKGDQTSPSTWLKNLTKGSSGERNYFEIQSFPWLVMGERRGPTYFAGLPIRSTILALGSTDGGITRQIATETTASAAFSMVVTSRTRTLSLGLSIRPNMRWSGLQTFSLNDVVSSKAIFSDVKSAALKTTATALDLGVSLTAGDFWLPTFAVSVLNVPTGCVDNFTNPATGKQQSICGSKRSGQTDATIDGTRLDPTEVRAGLSIIPRFRVGRTKFNMKVSGDIYPLPVVSGQKKYGFHDVNINQLTHAGVELYTGNALQSSSFSIRLGLNETRTSFGILVPLSHITVEATTYEAAVFSGSKLGKERRHLIGISSNW